MKSIYFLVSLAVLSSIFMSSSVSAAYGKGMGMGTGSGTHMWQSGSGKGMWAGSGAHMWQSGSGKHLMQKDGEESCDPASHLVGVATGSLSEAEKAELLYGYSEEMLARDMYQHFYEVYGIESFANIAESEAKHMEAVKLLLERYNIALPHDYGTLAETYKTLKAEGNISLQKALEVGMKIEMLDIEDIIKTIKSTDNDDLKIIFSHIGGASYNHLKGFVMALSANGLSTSIDYSAYLSKLDLAEKGKELKTKILDRLKEEWVILPDMAQNKQKEKDEWKKHQLSMQSSSGASSERKQHISEYKKTISAKYEKRLSGLSAQKRSDLGAQVDAMYAKIENSTVYTPAVKERYFSLLDALKELIAEQK